MTVYIDSQYKCHCEPGEGLRAVETEFFQGKCAPFIRGYRFVPEGETWTREDGVSFSGMAAPWKDYETLAAIQGEYEALAEEFQDMKTALAILEVTS